MKTIETERLNLRGFRPEDFDAIHAYASCPENFTYMLRETNTEADTRAFIDHALKAAHQTPRTIYQYVVTRRETGQIMGWCDLAYAGEDTEIGWVLHRDFWKRGYATEIGTALLRFGFEELGLRRIVAHCDAENVASYRVMEKIGMRREGRFIESRPAKADRQTVHGYSDELSYAILRDEWEVRKEIAEYNALPVEFHGFMDVPELTDGVIRLICTAKIDADPIKKWVPSYQFAICRAGERIGEINLRIGYVDGLYYGGQIGYGIDEKHRGNGYAARACRLLLPVAKHHGMTKLLITNGHTNVASRRVCEKLGARLVRVARVPEWHDLYEQGLYENIFEWDVE